MSLTPTRGIEINSATFALLRATLRGEVNDYGALVDTLGDDVRERLPRQIIRYAVSDLYRGDLAEVLKAFRIAPTRLLEIAYQMDGRPDQPGEEGRIAEVLLERERALLMGRQNLTAAEVTVVSDTIDPLIPGSTRHLPAPAQEILTSRLVNERYWLQQPLGEGAFAVVYKCLDTLTDAHLALKVFSEPRRTPTSMVRGREVSERAVSLEPDDEANNRSPGERASTFHSLPSLREAWLMTSLRHPAVLPVYDWGELPGRLAYLVAKLCPGDLRKKSEECIPPLGDSCLHVAQIADALDYIHRQGIIHRDVKPANILLDRGGQALLADFGLAIGLDDERPGFAGTPGFASPEQFGDGWFDGRADIYSLGITLYQLVTGTLPFRGSFRKLKSAAMHETPRPPSQVNEAIPAPLDAIIRTATAKDVGARYTTAAEMAGQLRRIVESGVAETSRESENRASPTRLNPYERLESAKEELSMDHGHQGSRGVARSLERVAASYSLLRNDKGALVYWNQAIDEHQRAGDLTGEASVRWHMSRAFDRLGDRTRAVQFARSALRVFDSNDPRLAARVREQLSQWGA